MKINRLVLDLSHHETVDSYQAMKDDGITGIIYKATQGTGYKDNTYWNERERAKSVGMLWGAYHFAERGNVQKQAKNFLSYAKVAPDELFCLDLEDYGSNTMTLTEAKHWVETVEAELGRLGQCVIYSGNTIKEMLGDKRDTFWGARRLWLAQYGSNPKVQASWDTFWLWQYSDGEQGPEPRDVKGTSDYVDSNSFNGTPQELSAQWSGNPLEPIPPPPDQIVVKILVTAPPNVRVELTQL